MARKDALLKITKLLVARRNELRKRFRSDISEIGHSGSVSGDIADAAFESTGDELSSQLAEMESRELVQIETALQRIVQGHYGHCDLCEKKIPVGRLNALPYSVLCVSCQQESEKNGAWRNNFNRDFSVVRDKSDDLDIDLSRLEIDLSK